MKSSYELAMERLNKASPQAAVTTEKKKALAELDARYAAKIAEREIFLKGELRTAMSQRDYEAVAHIEKQLVSERKSIAAELEEKKETLRSAK